MNKLSLLFWGCGILNNHSQIFLHLKVVSYFHSPSRDFLMLTRWNTGSSPISICCSDSSCGMLPIKLFSLLVGLCVCLYQVLLYGKEVMLILFILHIYKHAAYFYIHEYSLRESVLSRLFHIFTFIWEAIFLDIFLACL